jgi:hypothetical protein
MPDHELNETDPIGVDEPASWSTEHYGFDDLSSDAHSPPQKRPPASTRAPRRHRSRTRLLLTSGAVALALVTGTAGFAFAQGTGADGRGDAQVTVFHPGHDRGSHDAGDGDRR